MHSHSKSGRHRSLASEFAASSPQQRSVLALATAAQQGGYDVPQRSEAAPIVVYELGINDLVRILRGSSSRALLLLLACHMPALLRLHLH